MSRFRLTVPSSEYCRTHFVATVVQNRLQIKSHDSLLYTQLSVRRQITHLSWPYCHSGCTSYRCPSFVMFPMTQIHRRPDRTIDTSDAGVTDSRPCDPIRCSFANGSSQPVILFVPYNRHASWTTLCIDHATLRIPFLNRFLVPLADSHAPNYFYASTQASERCFQEILIDLLDLYSPPLPNPRCPIAGTTNKIRAIENGLAH